MLEFLELNDGLKILLAGLAGAVVGLERHFHGRAAGVRTNMLVAAASALIMLLSEKYYLLMPGLDASIIRIDPSRIAAGAITGVGFLGAGVIIKHRASVVGLTTAATVWLVSAIGLAFGAGMYALAVTGVVLALFSLFLMNFVEKRIPGARYRVFQIKGEGLLDRESHIIELFKSFGYQIKSRTYLTDKKTNLDQIGFQLKCFDDNKIQILIHELMKDPHVQSVAKQRQTLDD